MDTEVKDTLREFLIALADDELILGHRDSEWCGHAPILEEDIAFANLALDEIGHANLWYSLLAGLEGADPLAYADRLAFWRDAQDFRNAQLVELPNGDWAFTILRQYLFDSAEIERLEVLVGSKYLPLAQTAAKIRTEELYHLRHTSAWVRRLGLGTVESHQRLQAALDQLWPYTSQLFELPGDPGITQNLGIHLPEARQSWQARVIPLLNESQLTLPTGPELTLNRQGHTPYLPVLLSEMQSVARLDPEAEW